MNRKAIALPFAISVAAAILLSGCGGVPADSATPPVPVGEKMEDSHSSVFTEIDNVQTTNVIPYSDTHTDVVIFDIERDGQTLTCATKASAASGVSCFIMPQR